MSAAIPLARPVGVENANLGRLAVPPDATRARIHFADGRILYFDSFALAHAAWLELPIGIRSVLREAGDNSPVYTWEFV